LLPGLDLLPYQQGVAARLAGRDVAAPPHVRDAIVQPFVLRQMFDHDRGWPQRSRRFLEEAGEDPILKTLDVNLQRIDMGDTRLLEDSLQAQRRHLEGISGSFATDDVAGAEIVAVGLDHEFAV